MFNLDDGKFLVKLARRTIEVFLESNRIISIPGNTPNNLLEKSGAFVTLNRKNNDHKELRGCIGIVLPIYSLTETVIKMAISSSTEDPRFNAVSKDEISQLLVEVSCLTPPKQIIVENQLEYGNKIKVGKDGLIIEGNGRSGLLLPQVPIERNWDEITFLDQTCIKAGLQQKAWLDPSTKVKSFQAQVFAEKEPAGDIIELPLTNK
ncbi:MAG: TIGR00296 family protein [Candidatus Ranarchaeia archaeon]